jgi:hypothetical protein
MAEPTTLSMVQWGRLWVERDSGVSQHQEEIATRSVCCRLHRATKYPDQVILRAVAIRATSVEAKNLKRSDIRAEEEDDSAWQSMVQRERQRTQGVLKSSNSRRENR